MKFYSYFRSSAAFRVRIALNLKGLAPEYVPVNLVRGEQKGAEYMAHNPQGLVPAMELPGGQVVGQSLALLEWLEETHPEPPLLPEDPVARARVRSIMLSIACDIHPLCNMAVPAYLREYHAADDEDIQRWYTTWMYRGFAAIETLLEGVETPCCFGETPTLADVCLVPQVYNARRFEVSLAPFPQLVRIADHCRELEAFRLAAPEEQPDHPG